MSKKAKPLGRPKMCPGNPHPTGAPYFQKGNKAAVGHGYPKGRPNIATRFRNLIEKFSEVELPKGFFKNQSAFQQFVNLAIKDGICKVEDAEAMRAHFEAFGRGQPWAFDRIFGKVKEEIDITTGGDKLANNLRSLSDEDLEKRIADLQNRLNSGSDGATAPAVPQ